MFCVLKRRTKNVGVLPNVGERQMLTKSCTNGLMRYGTNQIRLSDGESFSSLKYRKSAAVFASFEL